MAMEAPKLKVMFLPFFTASHMIPVVEIARLFASRGITSTIVTTHHNALLFESSIHQDQLLGHPISIRKLHFPSKDLDLPEGIENFNVSNSPDITSKIFKAIPLLQNPIQQLIRDSPPDCIVSDMFFPWTVDVAEELGIPRLSFNPTGYFFHCFVHSLKAHVPHENVQSETETFLVPNLPDPIQITRSQLPDHVKTKTLYGKMMDLIQVAENRSYGTVINSFLELEPAYVKHFEQVIGRKGWHLGPLSRFCNREAANVTSTNADPESCLGWLDSQKPNSVLYISFGGMVKFSAAQLKNIALALEASSHPFIWVVKYRSEDFPEGPNWLPGGFEERIKGFNRGVIIKGWAPQVLILDHPSIGGFMTHCGWNSIMEAVSSGVPLITWPLFSEQFYNEKLITQVLKIGVEVGAEHWNSSFVITSPVVVNERIVDAVNRLMDVTAESEEMRRFAKELGKMAKMAVEEGGSSHSDLAALVAELTDLAVAAKKTHHALP